MVNRSQRVVVPAVLLSMKGTIQFEEIAKAAK
jgi:hypothetical protein